jgi:hypothetical protein
MENRCPAPILEHSKGGLAPALRCRKEKAQRQPGFGKKRFFDFSKIILFS